MVRLRKKSLSLAIALRWGEVCRDCHGGKCADVPSDLEPLYLQSFACETCGGSGELVGLVCTGCRGQKKSMLTGCPQKMVSASARSAIAAADFARKGILPLAGGWLDQADSAMKAIRFVWDAEEPFRVKCGMKD